VNGKLIVKWLKTMSKIRVGNKLLSKEIAARRKGGTGDMELVGASEFSAPPSRGRAPDANFGFRVSSFATRSTPIFATSSASI
jgi:hypothetical protein